MEYVIVNGELYHHGVKGQKWGVRRKRLVSTRQARIAAKESIASDNAKNKQIRAQSKKNDEHAVRNVIVPGILRSIGIHAAANIGNTIAKKAGMDEVGVMLNAGAIAADTVNIVKTVKRAVAAGKRQNSN